MKNIFLSSLFLLFLFSISTFIFQPTYLYYEIKWLDIPMHLLGGAGVSILGISIFKYLNKEISLKHILFFVLTIAIFWEIYEYLMHIYFFRDWNGLLDTSADIINGLIGGFLVFKFNKI